MGTYGSLTGSQNVAKMLPARVQVLYIRCRLYALYGTRCSALMAHQPRTLIRKLSASSAGSARAGYRLLVICIIFMFFPKLKVM